MRRSYDLGPRTCIWIELVGVEQLALCSTEVLFRQRSSLYGLILFTDYAKAGS
jgi:hypothetical protein